MVKEGSIIALGAHDDKPDYDYADGVELRVYGLKDGMTLKKSVYSMKKEEDIVLTVSQKDGKVEFDVEAEEGKAFTVRLMNRKVEAVEGAKVTVDGEDTVVEF
jgi:alpha-D-xyloside xylohydrolase